MYSSSSTCQQSYSKKAEVQTESCCFLTDRARFLLVAFSSPSDSESTMNSSFTRILYSPVSLYSFLSASIVNFLMASLLALPGAKIGCKLTRFFGERYLRLHHFTLCTKVFSSFHFGDGITLASGWFRCRIAYTCYRIRITREGRRYYNGNIKEGLVGSQHFVFLRIYVSLT